MSNRVFTVRYEIKAQHWRDGQFSVPKKVVDILALQQGDDVILEVISCNGSKNLITKMKSGSEIYGDLSGHVVAGETVVVGITKIIN